MVTSRTNHYIARRDYIVQQPTKHVFIWGGLAVIPLVARDTATLETNPAVLRGFIKIAYHPCDEAIVGALVEEGVLDIMQDVRSPVAVGSAGVNCRTKAASEVVNTVLLAFSE